MQAGLSEIVPDLREEAAGAIPQIRQDSPAKKTIILAERFDANIEETLAALFERVSDALDKAYTKGLLQRIARRMIKQVSLGSKRNTEKQLKRAYPKQSDDMDFQPLMNDKELSPFFDNVVDENVGLIRSIPKAKMEPFKNQLVALITKDATIGEIKKAIQKNFKVTKGKAAVIARDQVGKLNGALNKYRQQQLGGKRYYWRRTRDSRCRAQHEKLGAASDRGKLYLWSQPPIVDPITKRRAHPGEDFQCRCWAEMHMGDIFD